MIIIYDFDGTLTPYSMPQYAVLKKCGYDDAKLTARIQDLIEREKGIEGEIILNVPDIKKVYFREKV